MSKARRIESLTARFGRLSIDDPNPGPHAFEVMRQRGYPPFWYNMDDYRSWQSTRRAARERDRQLTERFRPTPLTDVEPPPDWNDGITTGDYLQHAGVLLPRNVPLLYLPRDRSVRDNLLWDLRYGRSEQLFEELTGDSGLGDWLPQ